MVVHHRKTRVVYVKRAPPQRTTTDRVFDTVLTLGVLGAGVGMIGAMTKK